MKRKSLKEVLMDRDGFTEEEADAEIAEARELLHKVAAENPLGAMDFMDEFGLEPDYLDDLM